jgi:hypothetical protein
MLMPSKLIRSKAYDIRGRRCFNIDEDGTYRVGRALAGMHQKPPGNRRIAQSVPNCKKLHVNAKRKLHQK